MSSDVNNITVTGVDAYDKSNIDGQLTTINTNITAKQPTLSTGTLATGSQALLSGATIKSLLSGTGISLVSGPSNITITGIDVYTKSEVNNKLSDLISTAPAVMNTLAEIANVIGDSSSITSSLISLISNKANSSDTFTKTILNNDVYLPILSKRFVSSGTTNNRLILQIQDSVGGTIGDHFYDAITVEMDIITKNNKCIISDKLIVNAVDVLTELATKVNSSSLSSYAQNDNATFTNSITSPILFFDASYNVPSLTTRSSGSK